MAHVTVAHVTVANVAVAHIAVAHVLVAHVAVAYIAVALNQKIMARWQWRKNKIANFVPFPHHCRTKFCIKILTNYCFFDN